MLPQVQRTLPKEAPLLQPEAALGGEHPAPERQAKAFDHPALDVAVGVLDVDVPHRVGVVEEDPAILPFAHRHRVSVVTLQRGIEREIVGELRREGLVSPVAWRAWRLTGGHELAVTQAVGPGQGGREAPRLRILWAP